MLNPTTTPGAPLTRRESEAMALRALGLPRREVARVMGLTRPTVTQYFLSARIKLCAGDYTEALKIFQDM